MDLEYLKLLEYDKELNSKGTTLYAENKQDGLKLLKYQVSIWNHFQWEQKDRFFLVIRNFLDKKIDIDQYISQFLTLYYGIRDLVEELNLDFVDFEKLKEFQPNPVSEEFSELIGNLWSDCRVCEPDPDLRDNDEISETQLIDYLREAFLKLQEYE